MAERALVSQTNFSGGQVDAAARRRDDSRVAAAGARVMANWRVLNSGVLTVRPGRMAFALSPGARCERFRMTAAKELIIAFHTGEALAGGGGTVAKISLFDRLGSLIMTRASSKYLWTDETVALINWTVTPDRIVVCFPGMRPQVIFWDFSTDTFSFDEFKFSIGTDAQLKAPFARRRFPGATMSYSGVLNGRVGLRATVKIFTPPMIGQRISLAGQQCTVENAGGVIAQATPAATLNHAVGFKFGTAHAQNWSGNAFVTFPKHSIIQGVTSKTLFEVTDIVATDRISAIRLTANTLLGDTEHLASQFGVAQIENTYFASLPQQMVSWSEEFMNSVNGWPEACFFVNNRLGFCDFPQAPEAILLSSAGIYDHFWIDSIAAFGNPTAGASATSAMLEFISGKPHVRNVAEWNGDIFVLTDKGPYYIPVAASGNPLKPGSVEFRRIGDATASHVKPIVARDALVFTSASGSRISAMVRTGNATTPYIAEDLTELHSSLVKTPVCITGGHGDNGYPEIYAYVVNSDGSVIVGKVEENRSFVGWQPWAGAGAVSWISSFDQDVLFTTRYGAQHVLEYEDDTVFLDHSVNLAEPKKMAIAPAGPLIAFKNAQARVMDGAIDYGLRRVDATGNLVKNPEDDFSSKSIVCGSAFISIFSPFAGEAPPGAAIGQRQRRRKLARAIATVNGSSGCAIYDGSYKAETGAAAPAKLNIVNLALNRPVTASSFQTTDPGGTSGGGPAGGPPSSPAFEGGEPQNAVDGSPITRWLAAYSDPQWIYVDLGGISSIVRVRLTWKEFASSYSVQTSNDAVVWTDIFSTTTGNGGMDDITGLSGLGRYVRMHGTVRGPAEFAGQTPGYSLWEFEVFGVPGTSVPISNLALNKPATASSIFDATFPASNAVDGNLATRWASGNPQKWVYVDLQATFNITQVKIVWQDAYATSYKVQVSSNAIDWTDIFSTTTGDGGTDDLTGLSGTGRYVRMHATSGVNTGVSLWELEAYGNQVTPGNLALNKPATASSIFDATFPASNAVDGNLATRWASGNPQWIYVDLGGTFSVTKVKITWEALASSYKVQVSSNAIDWTDIFSTTTGDGGTDDLTGLSGSGRYVRVLATAGASSGYSIWELEAYAPPPSPPQPPPREPNIALNRPAEATSSIAGGLPSYAFDGDLATSWSADSSAADPQSLSVDLGAVYNINRVRLTWGPQYAKSFQVQASFDNIGWTDIYATNDGIGGVVDIVGIAINGRYVRMLGTVRAASPGGYTIAEFEVYGPKTTSPVLSLAVPPYDFGQDATAQPALKETTYTARFIGRDFDPRVTLVKDTPGPLTIIEFNQEVSI